ncbi:MAG: phenylalanine--tRNA ligase subunit beta [Pseudomonadota bacterium]
MNVLLSWLKDYVATDASPRQLADLLTMRGLEVESLRPAYGYLEQVVVGQIKEVRPLPDSGRLRLCRVAADQERWVVCGAPNAEVGQLVPLAMPGARLPGGRQIELARVGGELSEGMLCSEMDLGLGDDSAGLMTLPPTAEVGRRLDQALGLEDWVLEVAVTPNRPDCLSMIGIAREVGAACGQKVRYPNVRPRERRPLTAEMVSVFVERPDLCPRYTARIVRNTIPGPSPAWMQARLRAAGMRPINNLVDVTNYVLLEYGQPLHAFDYALLAGNRLIVRAATAGERITTLDGVARELNEEALLICDAARPVALAGIMGGGGSEVNPSTHDVVIESALFDRVNIRRTSKRLGLSTESSYRFERGVDPIGMRTALDRAAQLMADLAGGEIAEGAIDCYAKPVEQGAVKLRLSRANALMGLQLSGTQVAAYLRALEMEVQPAGKETFFVRAPSFRMDISREADLIEEIARSHGYGRISAASPRVAVSAAPTSPERSLREAVRGRFMSQGLTEVINYSFISGSAADRLGLAADDPRRSGVNLLNPLSEDQAVMRTSLVPGLIETARRNVFQGTADLRLFEVGRIFLARQGHDLPLERLAAGGLLAGYRTAQGWHGVPEPVDFYDVKGVVETLFSALRIGGVEYAPDAEEPFLVPGESARLLAGGRRLGFCGRMLEEFLEAYGLKGAVYLFELDLDEMLPLLPCQVRFQPLPRYPAALRDVAFMVAEDVPYRRIVESIEALGLKELEDVRLFDVYRGKPLEPGYKSMALSVSFRSPEKTLDESEVNALLASVINACEQKLGAVLRSACQG